MPVTAYIGIGSNMGDRKANCLRAIELLSGAGRVTAVSSLYYTEPVGYKEQEDFINAAAALETALSPHELLAACMAIEQAMGRMRTIHWGPRTIDLDILLFGEQSVSYPDLVIPHPLMASRKFVLAPLAEIAPGAVHPVLKKTIQDLFQELKDTSTVIRCRPDRLSS
jgi:2-amino-4-hydroxy-6-hydroxymethyldihydropteridine diphosphokinase